MSIFQPNVQKMKNKCDILGLIKALEYRRDKSIVCSAVKVLGELKDNRAVEPLITELNNEDKDIKISSIIALCELRDNRSIAPLIAILKDNDKDVRMAAAVALSNFNDTHAFEALCSTLTDEDSKVCISTIKIFGSQKEQRAIQPLISMLKDSNVSGFEALNLHNAAISAFSQIGSSSVEPLINELKSNNIKMRCTAASILGELADSRALQPLIVALKDNEKDVRRRAAESLSNIKDKQTIEPLIVALRDGDDSVRGYAANALAKQGEFAVNPLISLLNMALKARDMNLISIIPSVLSELMVPEVVDPLVIALSDPSEFVRWEAFAALDAIRENVKNTKIDRALSDYCIKRRKLSGHLAIHVSGTLIDAEMLADNWRGTILSRTASAIAGVAPLFTGVNERGHDILMASTDDRHLMEPFNGLKGIWVLFIPSDTLPYVEKKTDFIKSVSHTILEKKWADEKNKLMLLSSIFEKHG